MDNIKTIQGLCSAIAEREGKKSESHIGDIREIISILSDIMFEAGNRLIEQILYANGERRHEAPPEEIKKRNDPKKTTKEKREKLQLKRAVRKFKLAAKKN